MSLSMLTEYRFFVVNGRGQVVTDQIALCEDDADACLFAAHGIVDDADVEVWELNRLVARMHADWAGSRHGLG